MTASGLQAATLVSHEAEGIGISLHAKARRVRKCGMVDKALHAVGNARVHNRRLRAAARAHADRGRRVDLCHTHHDVDGCQQARANWAPQASALHTFWTIANVAR
jgi:hypothetical protein